MNTYAWDAACRNCAGGVLATYECGAAVSASPAFDGPGRRAYVACLDGTVHCLAVRHAAGQLSLALAWRRGLSGPLFSAPVVGPDGALLVAAVDGTVSSLSSAGACSHAHCPVASGGMRIKCKSSI